MATNVIDSLKTGLTTRNKQERSRKDKSFLNQRKIRGQKSFVLVTVPESRPHSMNMLQRRMQNIVRKEGLSKRFKNQLKNSDSHLHEPVLCPDSNFNFNKPWLELTNDDRANRINKYVSVYTTDEIIRGKMRCILLKGITGKLLEPTSLTYDEETATIMDIPSLQYNESYKDFYFL
jgi:hypothetical protein